MVDLLAQELPRALPLLIGRRVAIDHLEARSDGVERVSQLMPENGEEFIARVHQEAGIAPPSAAEAPFSCARRYWW